MIRALFFQEFVKKFARESALAVTAALLFAGALGALAALPRQAAVARAHADARETKRDVLDNVDRIAADPRVTRDRTQ